MTRIQTLLVTAAVLFFLLSAVFERWLRLYAAKLFTHFCVCVGENAELLVRNLRTEGRDYSAAEREKKKTE